MLTRQVKIVGFIAVAAVVIGTLLLFLQRRSRLDALMRADPQQVLSHPSLARTALEIGRPAFERRCAGCHGDLGAGNPLKAAPALTDRDPLYDTETPDEVEQIVLYGIRSGNPRGRNLASMPAYARARPYMNEPIPPLSPTEIADATQLVLSLSGRQSDNAAAARGQVLYQGKGGCYDCHGADARGDPAIGAPNLTDAVWLYGDGSAQSITESISYGRAGICPAFSRRISPLEARAIAIYASFLAHGARNEPPR